MFFGAPAPEAFREDCARIWGNLYDYSMTKYQETGNGMLDFRFFCWNFHEFPNSQPDSLKSAQNPAACDNHTPVLIGCPLHGIFRLRPRDHLQRRLGCPKCGSSIPGSVDGSAAAVLKAEKTPRLGQHLLQSYGLADDIARVAVGSSGGWVAEIGVGTGILTSALLRRPECTGVVGFEMDEEILKEGFARGGALQRCGAVQQRVTDEALLWSRADWAEALRSSSSRCHVLMVQLEFAKQLTAKPGSVKFGVISALCAALCARCEAVVLERVPPEFFSPAPRVESQVVLLEPRQVPPCSPQHLEPLLRALLGPKTLKDVALETALEAVEEELPRLDEKMGGAQLDPAMRVAELSVEDLVKLCNALERLRGTLKSGACSGGILRMIRIKVSSYITPPHQLRVKMHPGKNHEDLFNEEGKAKSKKSHKNSGSSIMGALQSLLGGPGKSAEGAASDVVKKASDGEETIHIFSVASGHLYEKLLGIMILSVRNNTQNPLHFWFIDNFLSPKFKAFIPMMAQRYDFKYDFVTYKWPSWLNPQSEKQRLIWAYKILFLDVLFPQDVPKIIFIDADQVVRADVKELWELDLQGKVYGFVPMGDSNPDTEGFRFWKQGYWKSHLGNMPYHISALFVVDLIEFRRTSTGETLRGVYNQLSRDPNSLANLDQDLPNFAQHQVPIFTLPTEWLWCETWCSQESKEFAKTIDLCQNPLTKEPKIVMAKRIISEWQTFHNEVQALQEEHDNMSAVNPAEVAGKAEL
eukprot:s1671_g12.t1